MQMQFGLNAAAFIHRRTRAAISEMSPEAWLDDGEPSHVCARVCGSTPFRADSLIIYLLVPGDAEWKPAKINKV